MLLDKIFTLVMLASLQGAVRDWCPALLASEQSCLVEDKPETVEDTYAYLIQEAKPLAPLKSKETPMFAASNCIHHKTDLKAGGNGSASWIVCKACHSRWEMNYRAADLKKELKMRKGLLNQSQPMEMDLPESYINGIWFQFGAFWCQRFCLETMAGEQTLKHDCALLLLVMCFSCKRYMHCTHTTAHSMTLSSTRTDWLKSLRKRLTDSSH